MSITSTVVDRADTQFVEAADVLRPYVGCYWVITAQPGAMIRVVPDGTTSISIQVQPHRSLAWFLRGPLIEPQVRRFRSASTLIGVRLRPGVAFLVSGTPAGAMVGRRVRLSGARFRALNSAIGSPSHAPAHYIDVLQRFLIERLAHAAVHPIVAKTIERIQRERGCVRVGDIAAECAVSQRHLHRLMRTWIGYGAKRLGRIARFQTALEQIDRSPGRSGASLAYDSGYFDQAHLTVDMARLANATPGQLKSRSAADFYKTRCDEPL
jgi:AraC-like DNA-binding protein